MDSNGTDSPKAEADGGPEVGGNGFVIANEDGPKVEGSNGAEVAKVDSSQVPETTDDDFMKKHGRLCGVAVPFEVRVMIWKELGEVDDFRNLLQASKQIRAEVLRFCLPDRLTPPCDCRRNSRHYQCQHRLKIYSLTIVVKPEVTETYWLTFRINMKKGGSQIPFSIGDFNSCIAQSLMRLQPQRILIDLVAPERLENRPGMDIVDAEAMSLFVLMAKRNDACRILGWMNPRPEGQALEVRFSDYTTTLSVAQTDATGRVDSSSASGDGITDAANIPVEIPFIDIPVSDADTPAVGMPAGNLLGPGRATSHPEDSFWVQRLVPGAFKAQAALAPGRVIRLHRDHVLPFHWECLLVPIIHNPAWRKAAVTFDKGPPAFHQTTLFSPSLPGASTVGGAEVTCICADGLDAFLVHAWGHLQRHTWGPRPIVGLDDPMRLRDQAHRRDCDYCRKTNPLYPRVMTALNLFDTSYARDLLREAEHCQAQASMLRAHFHRHYAATHTATLYFRWPGEWSSTSGAAWDRNFMAWVTGEP